MVTAAAVEPVGDAAIARLVLFEVGVEQQQRDAADLRLPDVGPHRAARDADPDRHDVSGRVAQLGQRQPVRIESGIVLLLPAVGGQGLHEVAGAVEQPDPDDRDAEVAGRLQVVTGQDAEAAAVLRQRLGDAELGREVRDRRRSVFQALIPAQARSGIPRDRRTASPSRRRKSASEASFSSRSGGTSPSSRTGSCRHSRHTSGSTDSNRSSVSGCQDQRRFSTSSDSGASGSGRRARTVKRRRALTKVSLWGLCYGSALASVLRRPGAP